MLQDKNSGIFVHIVVENHKDAVMQLMMPRA